MKAAMLLAAAGLVAACGSLGPREADRYFVLDASPAVAAAPGARAAAPAARVLVMPTTAAGFYDTQDIVYSREPGTRAYYQFSHWTERPQRAVHAQLLARLGAAGGAGGPMLITHLDEIYHDAAQPPGAARLALTAQLVDPASRAVLARRSFSASAPAASHDAPGAVAAAREALGALLDDVAAWVAVQAAARPVRAQ
jgi:cholesterol transport system auxiliary component